MLTLTLSFLTGLSLVFFLSTIYAHSKQMLTFIFALLIIGWAGHYQATCINVAAMYPPLTLFKTFSWSILVATCAVLPFLLL
jgi:hypothetical protein